MVFHRHNRTSDRASVAGTGVAPEAFRHPTKHGGDSRAADNQSAIITIGWSHLDRDELLTALDPIGRLKKRFAVFNATASLREVADALFGMRSSTFLRWCYKYFYVD